MTKELILDFETMSTDASNCAVIDCSFFVFDRNKMISDNPYTCKSIVDMKKCKLSIKEQVEKYGYKVSNDTIDFWSKQPKEVQRLIAPKSTDITVKEFASELFNLLNSSGKISYWWTRSSTFDPIILWRIMEDLGMTNSINEHLPFWKHRDMRTYIDAKLDFPKVNGFAPIENEDFWNKIFKQHDSSWDILADVLRIQAIARAEKDLKMI